MSKINRPESSASNVIREPDLIEAVKRGSLDRRGLLKAMALSAAGVAGAGAGLAGVTAASADAANPLTGRQSGLQKGPALAGTAGTTYQTFNGWDFHPLTSGTAFAWSGIGPGYALLTAGSFMLKSFVAPHGSKLTEVSFFVTRPDTSSTDQVGFFYGQPSADGYTFALTNVPSTGFQRVDVPFTAIPVDTTTNAFTLFMNNFSATNRLLQGARIGYTLNPGLTLFSAPARIYGQFANEVFGATVGPIDATKKIDASPSGVPAGARAAYAAVQALNAPAGRLTLYPDGTSNPNITNWVATVPTVLNLDYVMIPLSSAGKFLMQTNITGNIFIDVWGYAL